MFTTSFGKRGTMVPHFPRFGPPGLPLGPAGSPVGSPHLPARVPHLPRAGPASSPHRPQLPRPTRRQRRSINGNVNDDLENPTGNAGRRAGAPLFGEERSARTCDSPPQQPRGCAPITGLVAVPHPPRSAAGPRGFPAWGPAAASRCRRAALEGRARGPRWSGATGGPPHRGQGPPPPPLRPEVGIEGDCGDSNVGPVDSPLVGAARATVVAGRFSVRLPIMRERCAVRSWARAQVEAPAR